MIFCMLKFLSYSQVRQTGAVKTVSVLSFESAQDAELFVTKRQPMNISEGFSTSLCNPRNRCY